jgi:choline kinase
MARLAPLSIGAPALNPGWPGYSEADKGREDALEAEVQYLTCQTRLWRAANSAQWVAWGIVQAKVPSMENKIQVAPSAASESTESGLVEGTDGDPDEVEFDYLAYAQDRALFFWADVLRFGLVSEDQLPAELLVHIKAKTVSY